MLNNQINSLLVEEDQNKNNSESTSVPHTRKSFIKGERIIRLLHIQLCMFIVKLVGRSGPFLAVLQDQADP